MRTRLWSGTALLLSAALLLAATSADHGSGQEAVHRDAVAGVTDQQVAAADAEQLSVAFNAYENNITPFTLTMQALPVTHDLVHLVYDSLFWSQTREDPDPWLAESAEPNDDLTTWTVHLRQDVTWHDGEPFTAEDVAFTFEYFTEVHREGRYAHHVFDIPAFSQAEVIDDHTVELTFEDPAPTFEQLPGGDVPIVPEHVWADIEEPATETEMLPVGTGPFEVVDIEPDEQYRLEAHDDYFMGEPTVDTLVLPIVQDPSSAFAGVRTGEYDSAVHRVAPELVEDFEEEEDVELARSSRMESVILFFNTRRAPADEPDVRKAIALAIDRDDIVDTVMLGHAEPGRDSFTHPESVWALPDEIRDHDPEQAAELLDEAGYDETDEDGTRVGPDGEPLSIEVEISSFAPQLIRSTELAAEHVAEVGVELTIDTADPATIISRRRPEGPGDNPPVEAYTWAMESHMHADPDAMIHFFGSPQPGRPGGFFTGYANEEFDDLAEQAAVESDPGEREDMIHELQETFAEEVPAIVLHYPDGIYAYRTDSFDGWVADPGHGHFNKRSFIPADSDEQPEEVEDPEDDDVAEPVTEDDEETDDGAEVGAGLPWGWIVALLVAAGVGAALFARSRSQGGADYD